MNKTIFRLAALTAILAVAYFSFSSHQSDSRAKKDPVITVTFEAAHKGSIDVFVDALGSVTPHNTVTVRSRVDGQLMKLNFQEGQLVKAGDVLAEIDARTYEAQLKQAQGQKMRDEASLQEARTTYERYKALLAKDSIPRQQLDTQTSLVKQFEGAIRNDQGAIENAATQLDFTQIKAPISGRVGLRQVDVGNIVHSSDTSGLVVITEIDPISVLFSIPEDRIPALLTRMKQMPAPIAEAWNREKNLKLATGEVIAVDNQVDQTTGTLKLRADFANPEGILFPNQFVNIRLKIDTRNDVTIIPSASLQRGAKGSFVYVIKDDLTAEARPIVVDLTEGENTLVASGLQVGEKVVKEGADSLRDGAKVKLPESAASGEGKPDEATAKEHHKRKKQE